MKFMKTNVNKIQELSSYVSFNEISPWWVEPNVFPFSILPFKLGVGFLDWYSSLALCPLSFSALSYGPKDS